MKRAVLVGVAAGLVLVAAVPVWLALDDGEPRRLGALSASSPRGEAGRLMIAGLNGNVPLPVDGFSFRYERAVGAAQADVDTIEVVVPAGPYTPGLVSRVTQGTKATSATLELLRLANTTPTAYLTFELTGVTIASTETGWSGGFSPGPRGDQSFAIRYEAMTLSCAPVACGDPMHEPGTTSELVAPDLDGRGAKIDTVSFVPPTKTTQPKPLVVQMGPTHLFPGLLRAARDGTPLKATTELHVVKLTQDQPQKLATYKLTPVTVTSLAISASSAEATVEVQLAFGRFGVWNFDHPPGAAPKATSFCWDTEKNSAGCSGL